MPPATAALAWMALSGLLFATLNAVLRVMAQQLDPQQALFLRYLFGLLVLLPLFWRQGFSRMRPASWRGQLWRGVIHAAALATWFSALPHVPLAEVTAISFSGPIFVMLGAALFLREAMRPSAWVAAGVALVGVAVVVAPGLSGGEARWTAILFASAPMFAASVLVTKVLTRADRSEVIVFWQAVFVTLLAAPLALLAWTWPTPAQWGAFLVAGILGSAAQWTLTQSFRLAEMSVTQPLKFLELVWAAALGWLVFADLPAVTTWIGAGLIVAATTWHARRMRR
jgi:drug/metabolite transporter (DMT)-like permease